MAAADFRRFVRQLPLDVRGDNTQAARNDGALVCPIRRVTKHDKLRIRQQVLLQPLASPTVGVTQAVGIVGSISAAKCSKTSATLEASWASSSMLTVG
jgi:hypothetical protein